MGRGRERESGERKRERGRAQKREKSERERTARAKAECNSDNEWTREKKIGKAREKNARNQKIIDSSQPEIYDKQEKNELSKLNSMDKDKKKYYPIIRNFCCRKTETVL